MLKRSRLMIGNNQVRYEPKGRVKQKVIGTCKLCHKDDVDLQDSHLIAQTFYRKIRGSEGADNSPVAVSKDSARFTNKQIHDYVLCTECEQRFGRAEDVVSRVCLQADGSFPLLKALVAQPRLGADPEIHVVSGRAAQIDVNLYVYFAASILWRAGVHAWPSISSKRVSISLGLYEGQLRLYLLNHASFPDDVAIGMFVALKADTTDLLINTPRIVNAKGYHHYEITIPGILFEVFLGQRMPQAARTDCLLRSNEHIVYLPNHLEQGAMKALLKTARGTKGVQREADLRRG